jgi:HEAT repeat protein
MEETRPAPEVPKPVRWQDDLKWGIAGGYVVGALFYIASIAIAWNMGGERSLNLLTSLFGGVLGWNIGVLLSPRDKDERGEFAEYGKAISAFITGLVVAKLDVIFSGNELKTLLADPVSAARLLVFGVTFGCAFQFTFIVRRHNIWRSEDEKNEKKKAGRVPVAVAIVLLVSLLVPASVFAQKSERQQLVDRYAKELKSRDVHTRVEAAEGLGDMEMAEAIEPLVAALGDRDAGVREAAANALWRSSEVAKPAMPALRKALADASPAVVIRAAGALIAMDEEPSTMADELRGVLQRGDEVDRFLAARALIGIESGDKLAGPIVDYLRRNSPDPKNGSDWSALRDNFDAGKKALHSLAETQDRKIIPTLSSRLNENYLTEPLLLALGDIRPRPDRWIETLLGTLNSSNGDVRETAVELLGKQTAAADVKTWAKPVSRMVTDKEKDVRDEAIRALASARGLALDAIGPVVQAVRTESDAEVRARAAEAVGEIADESFAVETAVKAAAAKEALPALAAALEKDASVPVRDKALRSIDKLQLDTATTVEILARAAVEQKDRNLRLTALQLLRNHGTDAAAAEATIAPLKKDGDELIRTETGFAIEAMKSDSHRSRKVTTVAAVDPGARDKALEMLRERQYKFTEEAYFSALNDVELDIVKAFLDAGMSPNHRFGNSNGNPAMRVLLESQEGCNAEVRPTPADTKAILKLLLARGGDPNMGDDNANTPLMTAAQTCDAEVIKILLGAKANMNAKNGSGLTAFEFGLIYTTDGAAALAAAGFRLSPDKVKIYREAYAKDPKKLALVAKATKVTK